MANQQTAKYTITVTLIMCLVASVLVASAAVLLKPVQAANKTLDFKTNVLKIAGIYNPDQTVEEQFKKVEVKIVDLQSGKFTDAITDVDKFDQRASSKNPELSEKLSAEDDIAKLIRREKFAKVFLVNDENGLAKVILPVRGYGLWSTMSGFVALDKDLNTVIGFGFYEQLETPGLGGEVDNPKWKQLWVGKKVYSESGDVKIEVIKGHVDGETPDAEHKVDGLSGATLTSNGVRNLVKYWMGDSGFKPFLTNLKNGDA
ncbi:Na(+)-translocating NADH-quinone reductase subunit C [Cellvibrio sp. KY-GH-1]|uniref:Na(+)-translocating NADH-quinone reductase subunit C n=1 Tax=Cellvibrio sp. KY-GH-1 TaxID=2303332 RepID=UPI0012476117|nr:Na(+)-translocating NADH-quinone reductase subunit C [Cellvibrio sp. KY-GH-1]QEY15540.1 Na(+)-translocating NADH-quinone reductase subunit C [Cellvibrio sp. KY-GH-1]